MGRFRPWAGLVCLGLAQSCAYDTRGPEEVAEHTEALELAAAEMPATPRQPPDLSAGGRATLSALRPACGEPCAIGPAHSGCNDACTQAVAAHDDYCVNVWWDAICVREAVWFCSLDCSCTHPLADTGFAQSRDYCGCASSVCRLDPFCCETKWDNLCADAAVSQCRSSDLY